MTTQQSDFQLVSKYAPAGDQPKAIDKILSGFQNNQNRQTLLGVTGSGKTYTMANIIQGLNRPTLVLSHNKTLAAQLYSEFKAFFPYNAVHYFVSYFDYYQPEAYIPKRDIYIEKDSAVNEEIDRLRLAATAGLLSRKDVIIVASVSCIYGLGSAEIYASQQIELSVGEIRERGKLIRQLTDIQYQRNNLSFGRSDFRVRGENLEIWPSYQNQGIRVEFFADRIVKISSFHPLSGKKIEDLGQVAIYPAKHHVTPKQKLDQSIIAIREEAKKRLARFDQEGKLIEAQRLESRIEYDIEMIEQTGYCKGIENYSRYLTGREAGEQPATLLDYFPDDFLMLIDESHISLPQVRGMYAGDRARKETLVEYGFRLPSALDNRPLSFQEFDQHLGRVLYISATPNDYELDRSDQVVEQIIRPTGLLDPIIEVRSSDNQVDDLIAEINQRVELQQRVLVTTLTKKLAEELSEYLKKLGIKTAYLHSDVVALERVEILQDLRKGKYDVLIGINLLREGLDLPEVSLVAIIDADKEGFLRNRTSLIQTIGRAARHKQGKVIMYADRLTDSMRLAIEETERRRRLQESFNHKHGITPESIKKGFSDDLPHSKDDQIDDLEMLGNVDLKKLPNEELDYLLGELDEQMRLAADRLDFEEAARLRDQIAKLKKSRKK
ncbi:excinuclease ABC subunit UvrB [Candidatus Saccharibacteria bacterium]|nr:excinuclease ABC subunit UvrB [Candidatus Saccharibacteria bacterium]